MGLRGDLCPLATPWVNCVEDTPRYSVVLPMDRTGAKYTPLSHAIMGGQEICLRRRDGWMPKQADIGSKKLANVTLSGWVNWLLQRDDVGSCTKNRKDLKGRGE